MQKQKKFVKANCWKKINSKTSRKYMNNKCLSFKKKPDRNWFKKRKIEFSLRDYLSSSLEKNSKNKWLRKSTNRQRMNKKKN